MECLWDLIYLKSETEDHGVAAARIELGRLLARKCPCDVDYIVPIPETGILYAQGYALETGIPLAHAVMKRRPKLKTLFIDKREQVLREIFFTIPELVGGKRIALIDETVISGDSLATVIGKVRRLGPTEIHVRVVAPPMVKICPFDKGSSSWRFLGEVDHADYFMVDSFCHLSLRDLSKYGGCSYCFGGLR